jgi:hypothetical protein
MVAEDVLQLVFAADDIVPFLFKACSWPEFLLFADKFVVVVVPAVLVPGEKLVITVTPPFHVLPPGAIEPGGNEGGAERYPAIGKHFQQLILFSGGNGHVIGTEKHLGLGVAVKNLFYTPLYFLRNSQPQRGYQV